MTSFKSAFILAILGKFRKSFIQQLSSVLIESVCWDISVEFSFNWHCHWGKLGLRSLRCRPVVAVDLEAAGKGSTTVVPRELKFGREAIDECGWIVSFTRRGFRQSWNACFDKTSSSYRMSITLYNTPWQFYKRFSRGFPRASYLAIAGFTLSRKSVLQHKACIKHCD